MATPAVWSRRRPRLEKHWPRSTFVVLTLYAGVIGRASEEPLSLPHLDKPALYALSGTSAGQSPYGDGVLMIQAADALLYIVPREAFTQAPPPAGSLEAEYLKESRQAIND